MNSLDSILSGQAEAVSEQPINEEVTQQVAEGDSQQAQQDDASGEEPNEGKQKLVPHEALHAEKQKTKRYTEEVSSLRQEIADRDAAWERRIAQLMEAQKPKPEPQQRPDWFENPDAAAQHTVQETINPRFDAVNRVLMENAKLVAGLKYGDDKIEAADKAFMEAVQTGKIDPADYQRVTSSPNIFAAAVQWHQRQQALSEIGDDPAAFRARVEAEILAKHGLTQNDNGQQQQQAQPAAVMPSNIAGARNVGSRSGPAWSGPPSLQDIFAR
jgi:hypothetical protein